MLFELGEKILGIGERVLVREVDGCIAWVRRVTELCQRRIRVVLRLLQHNLLFAESKQRSGVDPTALLAVLDRVPRLSDDAVLDRTLFVLAIDNEVIHSQGELDERIEDLISARSAIQFPV